MVKSPFITLIVVLMVVIVSAGFARGQSGDDFSVSCYSGNEVQYYEVGNLSVQNPSRNGVGVCNAAYSGCYNRCWACWDDSDGNTVCQDASGRQFSR